MSEAQNAQGLPVPLHNPDPLIDRGARPNPREGNTALSAIPNPSEPPVPTEGSLSPRCFSGLPHGGIRSLSGSRMLRVAGLPCCGLERGAGTPGPGAQRAQRGTRPIRIRFWSDKQPIQPIVRLGVGANREDQESLALLGGSCSLKMFDALRSGALGPQGDHCF